MTKCFVFQTDTRFEHYQAMSEVLHPDRARRGLRPDDVQELQTCLLLVLSVVAGGRFPVAPLRQGTMQEQARALARVRYLAPDPGGRHLRRLRPAHPARLPHVPAGRSLSALLQVPPLVSLQRRRQLQRRDHRRPGLERQGQPRLQFSLV